LTPLEYFAQLRQDVQYGFRTLASSPGFAAVALISLSPGIAITTCAFSEVNGLILRNLPAVPNPDELVALEAPASYPQYERFVPAPTCSLPHSPTQLRAPLESHSGRVERTWGTW